MASALGEMKKENTIRNSVIAGLAIAAIVGAFSYFFPKGLASVIEKISSAFSATLSWLGSAWSIPVWIALILILFSLLFLTGITLLLIAYLEGKKEPQTPAGKPFTEFTFRGIKWRWRLTPHGVENITPYCPTCDLQVYGRDESWSYPPRTIYKCDYGHWNSQEFEITDSEVKNMVEREIHRQIRNNIHEKNNT